MGTHDRAECLDCGRDVAVNKDGTLRKHDCEQEQDSTVETADVEQGAAGELGQEDMDAARPVEEAPDQVDAPGATPVFVGEQGPELVRLTQPVTVRKDPRLCAVPPCDRAAVLRGLCGAHFASRRGGGS